MLLSSLRVSFSRASLETRDGLALQREGGTMCEDLQGGLRFCQNWKLYRSTGYTDLRMQSNLMLSS
jgi:hypothetical protein